MERMISEQPRTEEAVVEIEIFLQQTAGDTGHLMPAMLERLSAAIEASRTERAAQVQERGTNPIRIAREERYRTSLERLRVRLSEIERRLLNERGRVLDDRARISQTAAWNESLSKTQ